MEFGFSYEVLKHPVNYLTRGGWYRYCVKQLSKCSFIKNPWNVAEVLLSDEKYVKINYKGDEIYLNNERGALYYILKCIENVENLVEKTDLPKSPVVMDIGANSGLFSFFLKKKYPNAKVIVVEPSKKMLEVIKINLSDMKDILILPAAMTDKDGEVTFFINEDSQQTNSTIYSAVSPFGRKEQIHAETVRSYSLGSVIKKFNLDKIDLIKIDIQGSELDVLKGGKQYFPQISQILTEVCFINDTAIYLNGLLLEHYKKARVVGEVTMGADIIFYND